MYHIFYFIGKVLLHYICLDGRIMNLYEGINLRKSVRKYRMEKLEPALLEHILNFTSHLEMLDENQQVQFEIIENLKGKYGKAPYYLVMSAQPREGFLVNGGFLMEQVMLYMLTKDLGTCFNPFHNMEVHWTNGFEPVIMIAFGKSREELYRDASKARRLPLKDLCVFKEAAGDEVKKILGAGRLAPSSMNSQPWRFVVYGNHIHLFCKKSGLPIPALRKLHRIDVGIALANMYLAAEELWYTADIIKSENIKEKSFKNNEYVLSLLLKK